jgi:cAMP-dependent protein kinase regulator
MGCGASKKEDTYKAPVIPPEAKPEVVSEVPKAAEPAATASAAADEEEEDDDNELGEEDFVELDLSKLKGGRQSVAAENMSSVELSPDDIAKFEKSEDAMGRIRKAMDVSFVFDALNDKEKQRVVESLKEVTLGPGETVIKQGDMVGSEDNGLYVVESGKLTVYKKNTPDAEDPGEEKLKYDSPGATFGELALLYNAPRAATVITDTECTLWALERTAFNVLVQRSLQARRAKTDELLQTVEFLKTVTSDDRTRLADAVKYLHYAADDVVFSQGDAGESMYIVASGKLSAQIDGAEVMAYETASFFGELALLNGNPRKATVTATEACDIISIDRAAFKRLLGAAEGFMREHAKITYGLDV